MQVPLSSCYDDASVIVANDRDRVLKRIMTEFSVLVVAILILIMMTTSYCYQAKKPFYSRSKQQSVATVTATLLNTRMLIMMKHCYCCRVVITPTLMLALLQPGR